MRDCSPVMRFSSAVTWRRSPPASMVRSPSGNQNSRTWRESAIRPRRLLAGSAASLTKAMVSPSSMPRKRRFAGLLKRRVLVADAIELRDVGLDVAGLVPVALPDLVLLGIQIFLVAGDGFVLEQLEPAIDAVIARQRCRQRDARLEHPGFAALEMIGQQIGRVDEQVRPIEVPLGITRQLAEILLQLPLRRAPGEIAEGLREAELGEALHQLRSRERLGEQDHLGMPAADVADQPLPERNGAVS